MSRRKQYWLVKQEPESYSWDDFVRDGRTAWTGVRNFQARNNLKAMSIGDEVFYYHSVIGKCVVGIAKVALSAYPDPTASDGDWVTVDLVPVKPLKQAVTLDAIKKNPALSGILLVRNSRISVSPLTEPEFREILRMARG